MLYDSNNKPIRTPKAPIQVHGMVTTATFRPDVRSLVLQIKELQTGKVSKPIQVSASAFPFGDNDAAMQELAHRLVHERTTPLTLEFNPDDNTGEVSGYMA